MTIKLHRNPSTGKLARNSVSGKLQVMDFRCNACINEVQEVTVTFSGVDMSCCLDLVGTSFEFIDVSVDGSYVLPLVTVDPLCIWRQSYDIEIIRRQWTPGNPCGNGASVDGIISGMIVSVQVSSTVATATLSFADGTGASHVFFSSTAPASPADCFLDFTTWTNQHTVCDTNIFGLGGTCTVVAS